MNSSQNQTKLIAYVDESGRHDKTGKQKGSGQIILAGWLDWSAKWLVFCSDWRNILEKYQASYFHFTEWADASAVIRKRREASSSFNSNPYKGWSLEKLDNFLYELAAIAGSGDKLIIGVWLPTKIFDGLKKHPEFSNQPLKSSDPYRQCLHKFFEEFIKDVEKQWRYWKEPVSFVFDQNDDEDWNDAVTSAFTEAKARDSRIAQLTFADKKLSPYLPLQAADMLAYRQRQLLEKMLNPNVSFPKLSKLDDQLIKPSYLKSSPEYVVKTLLDSKNIISIRSLLNKGEIK
jgi:hypothetical protein